MSYYELELKVATPKHLARDTFDELVDSLADAVADLSDGIDGDVSASHSPQFATVHLSLDDDTDEGAMARGIAAARTVLQESRRVFAPTFVE